MSKYLEPWWIETSGTGPTDFREVCAEVAEDEVVTIARMVPFQKDISERLVACVNALAGIPNPEAIPRLIEAAKDFVAACTEESPKVGALDAIDRMEQALAALGAEKEGK